MMNAQTCIVMPGRFGDIINILPCAQDIARKEGGKCAMVVSGAFASVLEGCSYVQPVIIETHFTDMEPAITAARVLFDRVYCGKVNEKNEHRCNSFNEESWRQIGYLDRWNDLPLEFDRRSPEREARFTTEARRHQGRKLVLVNFSGKSSPYEFGLDVQRYLPASATVVDLGKITAHRIYDLLGLMDMADLLITCDTATLHLAAASKVPVVNLIQDKPTLWHGSRPRNNSVKAVRYSDARHAFEGWKPPL